MVFLLVPLEAAIPLVPIFLFLLFALYKYYSGVGDEDFDGVENVGVPNSPKQPFGVQ